MNAAHQSHLHKHTYSCTQKWYGIAYSWTHSSRSQTLSIMMMQMARARGSLYGMGGLLKYADQEDGYIKHHKP